jgi:hypothetical protein
MGEGCAYSARATGVLSTFDATGMGRCHVVDITSDRCAITGVEYGLIGAVIAATIAVGFRLSDVLDLFNCRFLTYGGTNAAQSSAG